MPFRALSAPSVLTPRPGSGSSPLCGLDSLPAPLWWDPKGRGMAGAYGRGCSEREAMGKDHINEDCDSRDGTRAPSASSQTKAVRIFSLTDSGLREKGQGEGNGSLCPRGSSASSCLLLRQTNSNPPSAGVTELVGP